MKLARKPLKRRFDRCPSCLIGGLTRGVPALDGRPSFRCARCGHHFTNGKDGGEYARAVPPGFVDFYEVTREHCAGEPWFDPYVRARNRLPLPCSGLRYEGASVVDWHDLKIHSDDVMELVRRMRLGKAYWQHAPLPSHTPCPQGEPAGAGG